MTTHARSIRTAKILLTIAALEFFGPVVRDYGPSHAFHPDWVGHARVHLVWLLGFMFFSGLANLYLIWWRRPRTIQNLWLSVGWQSCNLGGFWTAYLLVSAYDGTMTVAGVHTHIFGYDENVFAFSVLTVILAAAIAVLLRGAGRGDSDGTD